jgi:hypothetical protein
MDQQIAFERDSTAHKRKIEVGFRRARRKISGRSEGTAETVVTALIDDILCSESGE